MLDPRIMELISAEIDGELNPGEQLELKAVLDSSPEAATFRDELLELSSAFRSMPELDPPPALAGKILDQVQLPAKPKLFSLPGFITNLNPAGAGLAFAAGLLLAVGFYETGSRNVTPQDTIKMVGTMVAGDQIKAPGQADRLVLDLDGLSGTVSLNVSEAGRALEFDLESNQPFEIELDIEKAGLMVRGFAQDDLGDGSFIDTLELSGGTMRVVIQGRPHFVVFLKQTPGSKNHRKEIGIGISREGERVYEDTLGSWR